MQNDSQQTSSSGSAIQSERSVSPLRGWAIPIFLSLITAAGAVYTAYSNHKTQTDIETLKANSERQITMIKMDTEKEIKLAELRSQENIIRLKNQLDAEKELRAQIAVNESAALSARAKKCDEIKMIRDSMSSDITHLRYNDPRTDDAQISLDAAANKFTSYITQAGYLAFNSALPKKKSSEKFQEVRDFYIAVLEGYNAEFRASCLK